MSERRSATAEVDRSPLGAARERAAGARRFVELFDLFDRRGRGVTAAEIQVELGWPQSSTADLLQAFLSLGLIYRDEDSREYEPTPRAAMLGSAHQPDFIRDGRLAQLATALQAKTGLAVALFGQLGLDAQIHLWRPALDLSQNDTLHAGAKVALTDGAAGWLLLSRMTPERRAAIARAIRARAGKTVVPDAVLRGHCETASRYGRLTGPVGLGGDWSMCGVLVPGVGAGLPLVVGLVFRRGACHDTGALAAMLRDAVRSRLAADGKSFATAPRDAGQKTPASPRSRQDVGRSQSV